MGNPLPWWIAQEVETILPDIVRTSDIEYFDESKKVIQDGKLLAYTELIPYLIASIQLLTQRIEILDKNKQDK